MDQKIGVSAPDNTAPPTINFQLNPAKKITKMPEAQINKAVPKSGCFMIKPIGINSMMAAIAKSAILGLASLFAKNQASIMGTAIRIISEG